MKALEELSQIKPSHNTLLTLGVFDGVHLGHRHLLRRLIQEADRLNCVSGVVTFRTHPALVLHPELLIRYICSLEERVRLLKEFGIQMVAPITFDVELAHLKAREFLSLLKEGLNMKGLVVGADFALGHQREGNIVQLGSLSKEMGFSLTVVDHLPNGDGKVSSTTIRRTVAQGDLARARRLLGRNFTLTGRVTGGDHRGRTLGYPTANLEVDPILLIPGDGIYATWAYFDGHKLPSATSIGVRPTFGPGERTIEAFILDFHEDIYNMEMRLEFVERLRAEIAFESPEALVKQMERDVEQTRQILAHSSPAIAQA